MALTREQFIQAVMEYSRAMFRAARAVLDSDADAEDAVDTLWRGCPLAPGISQ